MASIRFPLSHRLRAAGVGLGLCLAFAGAGQMRAESMVLTDLFGRSITAELVSLTQDNLKIRRDGQEFTLDIKNLSAADKQKVLDWARNQPAAEEPPAPKEKEKPKYIPDPKKITLTTSRFKGDSVVFYKSTDYTHKHETLGYSFSITNRNPYPAQNVRVEYNLFSRAYDGDMTGRTVVGVVNFPALDTGRTLTLKSKTAEVCKYRGFEVSSGGGELKGAWIKVFFGDQMIQEVLPPESVRNELSWQAPDTNGN